MYTFKQESVTNSVMRLYIEIGAGGNSKYYLMTASNGKLTTLDANDLVVGSQNDTQSKFRYIYE